uniref:AN1-type domain-containing protein n=1 Tax=Brassica campestris TaxID=3711 RepID=M4EHF8_BRACM
MESREIVPGIFEKKKKKKGTTMNSEQNNSTSFPPTEPELCDNRCAEPSSAPIATGQEEAEPSKPARTNRCFSCNKKAGVMGFKCKCGSTFCRSHRCPEKHECSFNFKEVGRDVIAKANHVIKEDKVERI